MLLIVTVRHVCCFVCLCFISEMECLRTPVLHCMHFFHFHSKEFKSDWWLCVLWSKPCNVQCLCPPVLKDQCPKFIHSSVSVKNNFQYLYFTWVKYHMHFTLQNSNIKYKQQIHFDKMPFLNFFFNEQCVLRNFDLVKRRNKKLKVCRKLKLARGNLHSPCSAFVLHVFSCCCEVFCE